MSRPSGLYVLASLGVVAALGDAATARASACPVFAPILFSYPSPDARRVPRNAVLFIVPDGLAELREIHVDGQVILRRGNGGGRAFFDPAPALFTPGSHVLELELNAEQSSTAAESELELELELVVDSVAAPPPDDTASARITAAVHFEPDTSGSPLYLGYRLEKQRVLDDPLDCSQFVADQTWTSCTGGGRPEPGDYHVKIEAEGDPLGFLIGGLFMPGYCRSAFFPSGDEPFQIQAVTSTGLGSPQVFSGELERYVAPAIPYPPSDYQEPRGLWESCDLAGSRGAPTAPFGLILLAGVAVALRRARRNGSR